MKTAQFTNFTDEPYTGYWNGKGRTYEPGESRFMPEYLARHHAKHLANRELLRRDEDGELIYPNGETMTSPKFPEQVPMFEELFNKAFSVDESAPEGDATEDDDAETLEEVEVKNRKPAKPRKPRAPKKEAVSEKTTTEEEPPKPSSKDDKDEFANKPVEKDKK